MNKESVMAILAEINDENSGRDLVSAGTVREVGIHDDNVSVDIRLGYHLADDGAELAAAIKATRLSITPVSILIVKWCLTRCRKTLNHWNRLQILLLLVQAKAVLVNPLLLSTWRWHCNARVLASACWMRIFTVPAYRPCLV